MEKEAKRLAQQRLSNYLENSKYRKTTERYTILDTIYSIRGHFSIDDINQKLRKKGFIVSRATLYNTINLFLELRLIIRHNFSNGTKYEACLHQKNHCHQICTMCNKVTIIDIPEITSEIKTHKFHRFNQEAYTLYIYGICSSCKTKLTRSKNEYSKKH